MLIALTGWTLWAEGGLRDLAGGLVLFSFAMLALSACGGNSLFDEPAEQPYQEAGRLRPACWARGAAFFVPPKQCDEGARMWNAAVERFGDTSITWGVYGHSRDWEEIVAVGDGYEWVIVAGATYPNGRIAVNIGTRDWCSGALIHEFWHARALQWGHENWPEAELEGLRRDVCLGGVE